MRAIACFDSGDGRGFARLNNAYIVLLPKKEGAICIGDYRPVSLNHSIAKIVAKAMALCLAGPLPHLVDINQSAFVKGRMIQDNFFMVQHSIRSLHRQKTLGLMLKLDMAKAFYSVSWPFLAQILRHRGFGPKWIAHLATLLSTANTRVLINGSAGARFWHAKGLRQGDPISPTLFILMMDVFNAVIKFEEENGLFSPFARSGIRHLMSLFANDVVLMIKPVPAEADAARQILHSFGEASGPRCNLAKSSASLISLIVTIQKDCQNRFFNHKSIKSSRNHSDSTVVVSKAVSSASIVDLVNMVCLQDLHDTAPPPKVNTYPLVAYRSATSEIQFESLYPSSTAGCPE
ncbi:hypothetical protein QYE76_046876 [Lolium multiflorum]|uniref:Reverse transcriptase domain-containing protein n=1 Tax=Lolium multiflorum TaxID=4521 RepID=A0AAD8X1G4_LOLMU|nr:hypothetical protein QYE76_046876 [Lolium multiflorum]